MAEFNPYKLEEEKWTPNNVYEILPPNAVSWSDYEFGQGTDNVDQEAANKSLIDGFIDFFKSLFNGVGQILGGAVELGGAILGGIVTGVSNFIGEIADAIRGITGDGARSTPIRDAIIAQLGPIRTQVGTLGANLQAFSEKTTALMDEQKGLIEEAGEAIELQDQKLVDANKAIEEAKNLTSQVKAIADANKAKVGDAIAKADDAIADAKTANEGLGTLTSSFNDKVNEIVQNSDVAKDAIQALNVAQNKIDIGGSLLPLVAGTQQPAWTTSDRYRKNAYTPPEGQTGDVWGSPDNNNHKIIPEYNPWVKVDPKTYYRVSFWAYSTVDKSALFFDYIDQNGNNRVCSEARVVEGPKHTWNYLPVVADDIPQRQWVYCERVIRFRPDVEYIQLNHVEWNYVWGGGRNAGWQHIHNLQMAPLVPDQAEIDYLQSNAIMANAKVGSTNTTNIQVIQKALEVQDEWNATQTKINTLGTETDKAQNDAIRALARRDLGGNLVTYLDLTDEDILAGKTQPDTPIWAKGLRYKSENMEEFKRSYWTPANNVTSWFDESRWVKVQKGVRYKVSLWVWSKAATTAGFLISMQGRDAAGTEYEHSVADGDYTYPDGWANMGVVGHWANGWIAAFRGFKAGWTKLEYTVGLKPEIEEVRINRTVWNYDPARYGTAEMLIADFRVVPDIPTQAQVDDAQNKAIKANTDLLVEQKRINQANIDIQKTQADMNELFQEQLWAQLDMIEQLDIQQSRVFHRRTTDGDLKPAPSWTTWSNCRYHENPFIQHLTLNQSTRKMYWVAKGNWEGYLKVTTNWTNGASDVMVYEIKKDGAYAQGGAGTSTKLSSKSRAYAEEGGAWGVDLRSSTFEIYPHHLGRVVGIRTTAARGTYATSWEVDESVMATGGPSLVRYNTGKEIRFTNSVRSTTWPVYAKVFEDGEWKPKWYAKNEIIPPSRIGIDRLVANKTYVFEEVNFTTNTW